MDFSAIPAPWNTLLPMLLGMGLSFAARAAVDWHRGRARLDVAAAERDLNEASQAMQKALKTATLTDDTDAAMLVDKARQRAEHAASAALAYESIAKAIEATPLAIKGKKP